MKVYTGNSDIELFEHLIEDEQQVVTHLVVKKGQVVPTHHVNQAVIVVPIKGKISFSDVSSKEMIYPGKIIQLAPQEPHALSAIEDSELMVIKSFLRS
ncbi:cupin domain-containing protein [Isobaculum melis]|uniref:AraC-like ligand binding domain-containing protein n=1 Tax=Isobaculum melis TaxID=142588 RepID=A0A1H9QWF4_9LACT|nr:cupin [Isobaculum melis]SER64776.1 hypothetical protein SAMN04488559_102327 [Isobaculum melis]